MKVIPKKNGEIEIVLIPEDVIDQGFTKVFGDRGQCKIRKADGSQPDGSIVFVVEGKPAS